MEKNSDTCTCISDNNSGRKEYLKTFTKLLFSIFVQEHSPRFVLGVGTFL